MNNNYYDYSLMINEKEIKNRQKSGIIKSLTS